jgi:hypothetical protein
MREFREQSSVPDRAWLNWRSQIFIVNEKMYWFVHLFFCPLRIQKGFFQKHAVPGEKKIFSSALKVNEHSFIFDRRTWEHETRIKSRRCVKRLSKW